MPTNASATPVLRNVTLRNLQLEATDGGLFCEGLSDSVISGVRFEDVVVGGRGARASSTCEACEIEARDSVLRPHCWRGAEQGGVW